MQERTKALDRLRKLISETRGIVHASDIRCESVLCAELKAVQLPVFTAQKVDYLAQERELLIQIISDYQIECKVVLFVKLG